MQPLPIDPHLPRITQRLRRDGALVLVGEPGSGKTTRVPPAILDAGLTAGGRVLVLEPRRIAARAAAARIASERGWTLGGEVGYTVRFESRTCRDTRLEVVTEGILTRRLQSDPFLEGVSAVVLDEFHERSIHSDLALALLREVRRAGRRDLLVLVMSATLNPDPVAVFLDGCEVITVEGRPHPVEIRHVDTPAAPGGRGIAQLAARTVREAWDASRGHVLVFLPGIAEIRRTREALAAFAQSRGAALLPLHGSLTLDEQQLALAPAKERKVVLSTNIAETSLTIEGVDLVIDSGLARTLRNDPRHGIDRLETVRISKHSAEQRAGRAGRLGPGTAIRLWTRAEHAALAEAETPEIRRVDLAATVLELRAWGVSDPEKFEWFEKPDARALERAEELLLDLGAIAERHGGLTATGRAMLAIPAHPRISRMLAAAHESGILPEAALAAAIVEERDLLRRDGGMTASAGPSDVLTRMDLFERAEKDGFRRGTCGGRVDLSAARAVARSRDALLRQARAALGGKKAGRKAPHREGEAVRKDGATLEDALLRVFLQAYPDRVVARRSRGSDRGRMVGGRGVVLAAESVVRDAPFYVALELDENTRGERLEARVRIASAVQREWIRKDLARCVRETTAAFFDACAQKVRATATLSYRDLPLEEPREKRPDPREAERLLAGAVRDRAGEIVRESEAAGAWLARARSLAAWMPELELPAFDAAHLGDILAGACSAKASVAEIRKLDLAGLLQASLSRGQLEAIERHAPAAVRVPSGNRIRLRYEPGKPPVLAARLQEMFGLTETPRVAGGRVAVLLHLLGPNFRPVQITSDLESFWNNTYAQVRKDLRARYPKHAWPEDPWTAQPSLPGRRKRH